MIRDVVGPTGKGQEVYAWLNRADGQEDDIFRSCADGAALAEHLGGLSTYARFKRFVRDFQAELREAGQLPAGSQLTYREERIDGEPYVITSLQTIAEYLSKKDYLANWQSEMFESFTFWEFDEWKAALTAAGFHVLENPNEPDQGSRVYCNPWIVANRYEGKVRLYRRDENGVLQPLPYPETNIILVGERR